MSPPAIITIMIIMVTTIPMRMIPIINTTMIMAMRITAIATTMRHRPRVRDAKPVAVRGRAHRKAPPHKEGPAAAVAVSGICDETALFRLMTWLSPSFPVGAFSYSSGIEWAVEAGDIVDAATLRDWLGCTIADGAGFCDSVFLAQSHRAACGPDDGALAGIAELAAAFVPSRERQLETLSQGRAFVEIATETWPCEALARLVAVKPEAIAYPVAVGVVSAGHRIPVGPTLHGFLHALAANWISAGVRLVPLGQTDGQRVLASLQPLIHDAAGRAEMASLEDLGSSTFRADIASMRHETQYTRLFRS
jgi:urease accessory protein